MHRMITRRSFLAASATLAAGALLPGLSGCGSKTSTKASYLEKLYQEGSDEVFLFTDSCGREVVLPTNIQSIVPSGAYAQIILCTMCPDLLSGLSSNFSKSASQYLPSVVSDLPVLGRFYGKNADMNYEEVISVNPDVIIDMGEEKTDIATDLSALQEQTGLPVIFIKATLDSSAAAYETLGSILGLEERGAELSSYVQETLDFAAEHYDECASRGLKARYSGGGLGYDVNEKGTVHAAVIDNIRVDNDAVLDSGSSEATAEQVMIWAPDVLLLSPANGFFEFVYEEESWASVPAVLNKQVYEVPKRPYEWCDKPPSVQQVLGIRWAGNLLYPDIYNYDMAEEAQRFFKLFWGYDLSTSEAYELMANSTYLNA